MNKARELKKRYGGRYLYRRYLNSRQIAALKTAAPASFPDTTAASLEVGCIRMNAVLFRSPAGIELGYDVLVKDDPDNPEWICYDAVPAAGLKETEMAETLDRYIAEQGLSYTDCSCTRLGGKNVKAKESKSL